MKKDAPDAPRLRLDPAKVSAVITEIIATIQECGVLLYWEAVRDMDAKAGADEERLRFVDDQIAQYQGLNPLEMRVVSRMRVRELRETLAILGYAVDGAR
jgi:hypothetical protein